jgi:2-polyprenyl-3-methyl-5-hydroxy-6-metoxy-1,4-benzoquinol methylase
MTEQDRVRWDQKYTGEGFAPDRAPGPPKVFAAYEHLFPKSGHGIDLACGRGSAAVWLAARGITTYGVDVSPVAVGFARELAERCGVSDRCSFGVFDLDVGLPDGPPSDVIVCHLFRDARLDKAVIERLAPGGLLAMAALSEVDHGPGPFRVTRGELRAAFAPLTTIAEGEGAGQAWLLAKA